MTSKFALPVDEQTLRAEFSAISDDRAVVEQAVDLLREWFTNPLYEPQRGHVTAHITAGEYALLLDSFYQWVPFGTGGRRGRVGYGPNRINDATVSLSVQGHCDYMKSLGGSSETAVVIAYDVRVFNDLAGTYRFLAEAHPLLGISSRDLARLACEIYAANGFVAYLPPQTSDRYLSTPELSFLIRHFRAAGGVNVSASHNHPDDNGFKCYTAEGAQDIPPFDEQLAAFMNRVASVRRIPFQQAMREGLIRELDAESHSAYISLNLDLRTRTTPPTSRPIVYTPLCGTGDTTVGDVLRAAGYRLTLFEPQSHPDGTFATVPSRLPNPEIPRAAQPAMAFADEIGATTIFSTDPDADRVGLLAKSADGSWRYLTGNEIATILAYYLILDPRGPRRRGVVIKSLVTSRLIEDIARAGQCAIIGDLLVGFKYIANVLSKFEREGRYGDIAAAASDLVLAAEESHGVLLTPEIRDKDAAGGALLLAELSSILAEEGENLPDYFDAVASAHGNYANAAGSLVMRGIRGSQALSSMMRSLRERPAERIGDVTVRTVDDYLDESKYGRILSETDRMSRNLLVLHCDGADITIRPSGTEPKVKIYVDAEGRAFGIKERRAEVQNLARQLAADAVDICLDRVGISLSPSAKLLPDFIDVDLKKCFDDEFRLSLLREAEQLARLAPQDRREWLRRRLAEFAGGADPLESTSEAVDHLCDNLARSTDNPALAEALAAIRAAVQGEDTR